MFKYYVIFGCISMVVIASVIYGFTIIGTPSKRMALQYDQTRMSHLQSISYQVQSYYSSNGKLPTTLADIKSGSTYKDPQTGAAYVYMKDTDTSYKLCAVFSADSADQKEQKSIYPFGLYDDGTGEKTHKKGYDCITFDIPESYKKLYNSYNTSDIDYSSFLNQLGSSSSGSSTASRDARRIADMHQVQTALELFYNDSGGYPASLVFGSGKISCGTYTYINPLPNDPSTNKYVYTPTGTSKATTACGSSMNLYTGYTITFTTEGASSLGAAGTHTADQNGLR